MMPPTTANVDFQEVCILTLNPALVQIRNLLCFGKQAERLLELSIDLQHHRIPTLVSPEIPCERCFESCLDKWKVFFEFLFVDLDLKLCNE